MPCKSAWCYLSSFTSLKALSNFMAITILKLLKVSTHRCTLLNKIQKLIGKWLKYSKQIPI